MINYNHEARDGNEHVYVFSNLIFQAIIFCIFFLLKYLINANRC